VVRIGVAKNVEGVVKSDARRLGVSCSALFGNQSEFGSSAELAGRFDPLAFNTFRLKSNKRRFRAGAADARQGERSENRKTNQAKL
jgi:hypothetical protein